MSVDNPEQILDQLMKDSITNTRADDPPQGRKMLKEQALAALEAYYKAQASKDMAEVIGNSYGIDQTTTWEESLRRAGKNELIKQQRKTAASKGYRIEGE